ncbi:hypothetical protein HPB50_024449 [Hyalomma asiaticum]|uniref:Uncharacterized protein n=1 Tax=Hyalomma asiaticum TaxID=266040 RepID=A0ACB7T4Q9_HYAAI|nr:hypothetical protein HPB50_024449 [Hyalomma asiaticum]
MELLVACSPPSPFTAILVQALRLVNRLFLETCPVVGSSTDAARRRWHRISRTVWCLVVTVGALLAVLALLLSQGRITPVGRQVCMSPSCQRYVRSLEASINPAVNPCDNFYDFVCAGWTPVAGGRSFMDDAKLAFQEHVMDLADNYIVPPRDQNALDKAALLYQSCNRESNHDLDSVVDILKDVGIPWPAVDDSTDPLDALFTLSFYWRCPVFFLVHVSDDHQRVPKLVIFRTFMGLELNQLHREQLSRDNVLRVCELYKLFSEANQGKTATHHMNYARSCETMARIQSTLMTKLYKSQRDRRRTYTSLEDFAANATPGISVDLWMRLISKHSSQHVPVTTGTPVEARDPYYVRTFAKILSETPKKDVLSFVGLTFVEVAGRFVSRELRELLNAVKSAGERERHALYCFHATETGFPGVLMASQRSQLYGESRVQKYWKTRSRDSGSEPMVHATMTTSYLKNLKHMPGDYWVKFNVCFGQQFENAESLDTSRDDSYAQQDSPDVPYVIIPDTYMLQRVFPHGVYESVNYASIGYLIARQLVAIRDNSRLLDADNRANHRLTVEEEARRNISIECLVESYYAQYNSTVSLTPKEAFAMYVAWASLRPLLTALRFSPGFPEWSTGFLLLVALLMIYVYKFSGYEVAKLLSWSQRDAPRAGLTFQYVTETAKKCRSTANRTSVLIGVVSSVRNFGSRAAIRDTWGGTAIKMGFVVVFLLGTTPDQDIQRKVFREQGVNGDIIQGDFADAYRNLTYKTVMLIRWARRKCSGVSFVLKIDDDMLLSVWDFAIVANSLRANERTMWGYLYSGFPYVPVRDVNSKWYVSKEEYGPDTYPDFLSGTGYLISGDVIPTLEELTHVQGFFPLEDIYLTAIVAERANVSRVGLSGFSINHVPYHQPCSTPRLVTSHEWSPDELRKAWRIAVSRLEVKMCVGLKNSQMGS